MPPYLAWGCALPLGWVCASGAFPSWGVGWGGGGGRPVRRAPRWCGRGGQWGGGSLSLVPSLCLPWAGNKAGVTGVVLVMEGAAPIPLRFVLACRLWARSVWRPGALAQVRLFSAVPVGAGGRGGGAGLAPAPLLGAAVLPGGGGTIPSASGGGGRRPRGLRAGGGGGRAAAPLLSLWGAACGSPLCRPLVAGAFPPPACAFGRGRGAAPCTWCSLPGGGGGWRPVNRPPGGSDRPNPSLCPPRVGNIAGVTSDALASGARPPYCSGSSSRAAPGHGPCVAPACWCGLARRPRPPQEQAGGGRRGARRAGPAAPPPGRRGPFWGRGDVPSAPGGQGGRRSCSSQAGGGAGGGGGGGAALLHPHLGFYEVPESRM